jgi:diadenosine tetraphosphate (Ap4A) HIT family hydrolase
MKPDKINLASLGNLVPHLHWHVIPRFRDDAFFPGSVWSAKTQQTPESVLAGRQKAALKLPDAIREQISQLY